MKELDQTEFSNFKENFQRLRNGPLNKLSKEALEEYIENLLNTFIIFALDQKDNNLLYIISNFYSYYKFIQKSNNLENTQKGGYKVIKKSGRTYYVEDNYQLNKGEEELENHVGESIPTDQKYPTLIGNAIREGYELGLEMARGIVDITASQVEVLLVSTSKAVRGGGLRKSVAQAQEEEFQKQLLQMLEEEENKRRMITSKMVQSAEAQTQKLDATLNTEARSSYFTESNEESEQGMRHLQAEERSESVIENLRRLIQNYKIKKNIEGHQEAIGEEINAVEALPLPPLERQFSVASSNNPDIIELQEEIFEFEQGYTEAEREKEFRRMEAITYIQYIENLIRSMNTHTKIKTMDYASMGCQAALFGCFQGFMMAPSTGAAAEVPSIFETEETRAAELANIRGKHEIKAELYDEAARLARARKQLSSIEREHKFVDDIPTKYTFDLTKGSDDVTKIVDLAQHAAELLVDSKHPDSIDYVASIAGKQVKISSDPNTREATIQVIKELLIKLMKSYRINPLDLLENPEYIEFVKRSSEQVMRAESVAQTFEFTSCLSSTSTCITNKCTNLMTPCSFSNLSAIGCCCMAATTLYSERISETRDYEGNIRLLEGLLRELYAYVDNPNNEYPVPRVLIILGPNMLTEDPRTTRTSRNGCLDPIGFLTAASVASAGIISGLSPVASLAAAFFGYRIYDKLNVDNSAKPFFRNNDEEPTGGSRKTMRKHHSRKTMRKGKTMRKHHSRKTMRKHHSRKK